MQNIVINMSEQFYDDWSINDGAIGDQKCDNNNPKKNNVKLHLVSIIILQFTYTCLK